MNYSSHNFLGEDPGVIIESFNKPESSASTISYLLKIASRSNFGIPGKVQEKISISTALK